VLSHAPQRVQAAALLIDAFQPEGVTRLAVDSIFMMPHLGVLSTVDEKAATDVFERDCLIYLGSCIAPVGSGKSGAICADYEIALPDDKRTGSLHIGELLLLPLAPDATVEVVLRPARGWDAGAGPGQEIRTTATGGVAGLVLDGRGRPIQFAGDPEKDLQQLMAWNQALNLYGE
jgi:hypothetical protein